MPLPRIVALLTPVFTALAAVGSGFVARHTGVTFSPDELLAIEIATATAAGGSALKWLHGSQAIDKYVHEAAQLAAGLAHSAKVEGITVPTESELVKAAEAKVADLAGQLAHAIAGRAAAEQSAGVALTRLAHVDAALGHIRKDPNIVLPDVLDVTPAAIAQPEDGVAADVAQVAPVSIAQPPVAADVGNLPGVTQVT